MDHIKLASALIKLSKNLIANSVRLNSEWKCKKDFKTKCGTEFKKDDVVALKTWEQDRFGRFETHDGRKIRLPLDRASDLLEGFPKPPSMKTLERWSDDAVAEAVDGSRVEPDGHSPSGAPSWLLVCGLI